MVHQPSFRETQAGCRSAPGTQIQILLPISKKRRQQRSTLTTELRQRGVTQFTDCSVILLPLRNHRKRTDPTSPTTLLAGTPSRHIASQQLQMGRPTERAQKCCRSSARRRRLAHQAPKIVRGAFRKLAHRAKVREVHTTIYKEAGAELTSFLRETIFRSMVLASHHNSNHVDALDVVNGIRGTHRSRNTRKAKMAQQLQYLKQEPPLHPIGATPHRVAASNAPQEHSITSQAKCSTPTNQDEQKKLQLAIILQKKQALIDNLQRARRSH